MSQNLEQLLTRETVGELVKVLQILSRRKGVPAETLNEMDLIWDVLGDLAIYLNETDIKVGSLKALAIRMWHCRFTDDLRKKYARSISATCVSEMQVATQATDLELIDIEDEINTIVATTLKAIRDAGTTLNRNDEAFVKAYLSSSGVANATWHARYFPDLTLRAFVCRKHRLLRRIRELLEPRLNQAIFAA